MLTAEVAETALTLRLRVDHTDNLLARRLEYRLVKVILQATLLLFRSHAKNDKTCPKPSGKPPWAKT